MEKATEVRSPMKEHDDDAVFGHYIATEIRAIDNNQLKGLVKWKIQSIIYSAQCGMLHGTSTANFHRTWYITAPPHIKSLQHNS